VSRDLVGLAIANGCFLAAGIGVTGIAGWWRGRGVLRSLGVSYLCGIAAFGVIAQLLYVLGASLARWQVIAVCAVLAAGSARGLRGLAPSASPIRLPRAAVACVVAMLGLLAVDLWFQPLWAYDAWTFWTPKANALYVLNGLDPSWFGAHDLRNRDYPLLLPAIEAATFRFTGYETSLLDLQSWLALVAFLAAVVEVGRRLGSRRSLLAAVPPYFSQAVITPDRRSATLAFGIRLMPLAKQQGVIDYMNSHLHPPPGVTARLAGLPVLAAQANSALSSSGRRLLTLLAGLLAVGLVLLAIFRRPQRALVPLIPIALATGWSALILYVIGIPLNPMSATLGALVIAISTEFSVLLSERFRQERAAGRDLTDALSQTYRSTGAAVLASGVTAIAGFGVLVFSSITMLRDFGFVTLIDLTVSLAGVLVVLPAVLVVSEREDVAQSLRGAYGRVFTLLPRSRRRARVA